MSPSSAIFLSIALRFLSKFSSAVFFILVPFVAISLNVDAARVHSLIPIFLIGSSLSQFFVGSLADTFGKRPVLLTLLSLLVAGSAGCSLSHSLIILQISVFVVALGVGAISGIGNTLIFEGYKKSVHATKALSLTSVLVIWAPALAMNFGSLIAQWDWRHFFIVQAVLAMVIGILAWRSVPQMEISIKKQPVTRRLQQSIWNYAELLSLADFRRTSARMCLLGGGIVVFYTVGITHLQNAWGTQHWLVYTMPILMVCANSLGRILAGLLPDRWDASLLDIVGSLMCFVSAALMLLLSCFEFSQEMALFTVPLFVAGVGLNFSAQRVQLMESSAGKTVTSESLLGILMAISGALISLVATTINHWIPAPLAAGILLSGMALWAGLARPRTHVEPLISGLTH